PRAAWAPPAPTARRRPTSRSTDQAREEELELHSGPEEPMELPALLGLEQLAEPGGALLGIAERPPVRVARGPDHALHLHREHRVPGDDDPAPLDVGVVALHERDDPR